MLNNELNPFEDKVLEKLEDKILRGKIELNQLFNHKNLLAAGIPQQEVNYLSVIFLKLIEQYQQKVAEETGGLMAL